MRDDLPVLRAWRCLAAHGGCCSCCRAYRHRARGRLDTCGIAAPRALLRCRGFRDAAARLRGIRRRRRWPAGTMTDGPMQCVARDGQGPKRRSNGRARGVEPRRSRGCDRIVWVAAAIRHPARGAADQQSRRRDRGGDHSRRGVAAARGATRRGRERRSVRRSGSGRAPGRGTRGSGPATARSCRRRRRGGWVRFEPSLAGWLADRSVRTCAANAESSIGAVSAGLANISAAAPGAGSQLVPCATTSELFAGHAVGKGRRDECLGHPGEDFDRFVAGQVGDVRRPHNGIGSEERG